MLLRIHHTFFSKFHLVFRFSASTDLMTVVWSILERSVLFVTILNGPKRNFCRVKIFAKKQFRTIPSLHFLLFYIFCFFKKIKVKLMTLFEGDPKAHLRWGIGEGAILYPWSLSYIAECYAKRHQVPFFESLVWLNQGLNTGLPGHWRTLYSLSKWHYPT